MGRYNYGISRSGLLATMTAPPRDPAPRAALTSSAGVPVPARLPAWLVILFLAAYVFADAATGVFPNPRFGVQPLSPHAALAIALITLGGARYAPAVFAAVVLGWALAHDSGLSLVGFAAAAATSAIYWAAASALRRWARWGSAQIRPRDVNVLFVVCLPAALLCAAVDAVRQVLGSELTVTSLPLLWFRIFVADFLGLAVMAPLLLQLASGSWLRQFNAVRKAVALRDAVLFIVALAALLELVFGLRPLDEFRMSYLLFLPMIVMAMRHGVFGVATLMPVVQVGLLAALLLVGTRAGTAFEFQLLMFTLAVATLYLGALSDERQRAAASMAEHERAMRERGLALAEAQRLASAAELAAALAHDLSQPLSAIGTYASASQVLAGRGAQDHPKLLETLGQITKETARAGQYLRRMRDFFQTGTMREESVKVVELIEAARIHIEDRLTRAHIHWRATLDGPLPPVRVDVVQMGAVLGNLVGNACDALGTHDGPREIHVQAQMVPGTKPTLVRVRIEDSGPGIAPELRERLFLPLATTKPNGMGLGLALSRSIAERQGGHLWYDDSRERTSFCLDLRTDA